MEIPGPSVLPRRPPNDLKSDPHSMDQTTDPHRRAATGPQPAVDPPSAGPQAAEVPAGGLPAVPSRRWGHRGRLLWKEWIRPLLIIGLVMFSFRSAVADWNDVPTGSMKPTILEGDRIFINKLAYDLKFPFTRWRLAHWDDPHWGDVVVLLSPEDGKRLVKRVVGLPGDVIEFHEDIRLYRNGQPADYTELAGDGFPGVDHPAVRMLSEHFADREHPVQLVLGSRLYPGDIPRGCQGDGERRLWSRGSRWYCALGEDEFFVMGDNRNNSRDSRYFGPVDRSAILGRATAVALSFDRNNFFKPRLDRFFSELP